MVEPHRVPPLANLHHKPLAGTLKQTLAFFRSLLHTVTASLTMSVTIVPC